jgi:hypothetical protein
MFSSGDQKQGLEKRTMNPQKILEISIESEIFSSLLKDLNSEIQRCIHHVYDEKFESGEIILKLTIEIPEAYENYPVIDESGDASVLAVKYRKPLFEHKVTTTLKQQYKRDGGYKDKRDIQFRDGKFIVIPITNPQVSKGDFKKV